MAENVDPALPARFEELTTEIRRVAQERRVIFADAAQVAHPGDDGAHLSVDSHRRLAELLASAVSTRS